MRRGNLLFGQARAAQAEGWGWSGRASTPALVSLGGHSLRGQGGGPEEGMLGRHSATSRHHVSETCMVQAVLSLAPSGLGPAPSF